MSVPAVVDVEARGPGRAGATLTSPEPPPKVGRHGFTARELVARHARAHAGLTATDLERWLVDRELATVDDDGLLHPTVRALELAAYINFLGNDTVDALDAA